MARLIREEIGDALWLGCGAPSGRRRPVDAMRIGRDIGVSWEGHYSAESLLRDQASRNFGNGIFGRPTRTAYCCATAFTISPTSKCARSRCLPGSRVAC